MAGGDRIYKKKIVVAGPLVQEALYRPRRRGESDGHRAKRGTATSEAQRQINAVLSWQKLKLLLAANFRRGDIVACLTFDDEHLPKTRAQVVNKFKWFLHKAAAARRSAGREFVCCWSIEHRHGDGRWHIHIICNATGPGDYAELAALWGQGRCQFAALRVDQRRNYETLARYMAKEGPERVGQRSWSYTRNARKPEEESFWVDDSTTLRPPRGAIVFADMQSRGEWAYIEYAYEDALKARRRFARARKKK